MLLSQSLFSFLQIKQRQKTKVFLFPNIQENNSRLRRRNSVKTAVLYRGYTYFTSPCHPLQLELSNNLHSEPDSEDDDNIGIGILNFFQGKNIFITGATGLLGKVLLEKILRSTPVGKVYLLIKAKDGDAAFDRLTKEVINSDLFQCLKDEHGKSYESFVKEKLIPIVGNICEPNLGMDSESAGIIKKEVNVIIHSAATTTLNGRYDLSLDANACAPQRLMRFAKKCKNLKLFVHISTAYVNGRKEGIILEKPLIMGENGRKEVDDYEISSSFPPLDVGDEINMALKSCSASTDYDATKYLKKLGQERAAFFGWYNTYHLTKAMGEMILNEIRGDLPVLIIRPSVIESSYKEPFPGWIQGNRMFDPVIISYGKGQLPAYLADPQLAMDIIPVDMVASTTIAAMAKHGSINKPQLNVYHVGSSHLNPLTYFDFFEYLYEYFNSNPLALIEPTTSIARIKYFDNVNDFSEYTCEEICRRSKLRCTDDAKIEKQCKAKVAYAEQLCKMYEFIGFFKARFHTGNTQKLLGEMSKEERLNFEADAMKIDWRKYLLEIHIPGLRRHIYSRRLF